MPNSFHGHDMACCPQYDRYRSSATPEVMTSLARPNMTSLRTANTSRRGQLSPKWQKTMLGENDVRPSDASDGPVDTRHFIDFFFITTPQLRADVDDHFSTQMITIANIGI